jgi:PAS domain S-box-containing protein
VNPEKPTLEETIALLEATLDATRDGILVFNLDGRIVRYNRNFLRMFNLTAEQLAARGPKAIVEAIVEQVEDGARLVDEAHAKWQHLDGEITSPMRFKDGRVFQRFVAPHQIDGRIVGRVITYHDVSEAARAAAALEQHRAFLEKAQEVGHVGSWVAELDGSDRLGWSAETYRIFGLTPADFPGTSAAFISLIHPEDAEHVRHSSAAAIDSGQPYSIEHRITRADGEVRWVHEQADVVRDADGKPLRMIGTVQDITERRRLEEQLRAVQRIEAIGRLAGGVAHDLNNALTAIAGYTELATGLLEEHHPARADVLEIRRAAERAESVTRQLLAFSRKQLLAPRPFSLAASVTNLGRLLQRVLGENIQLTTDVGDNLPSLYGDAGQIEQAILNLAVNARDAMPDGGHLTLRASLMVVDEAFAQRNTPIKPGPYVELCVSDTGHGMSPQVQAHIFEPFFTTKELGKGTGLGLSMVYGTVKQSGGFIFVDSEVGRGTTFRLYFPPGSQLDPAIAGPGAARVGAPTILVVEDERQVRNLVVLSLERDGYRVLQAESAREALELARAETSPIDLLLTDGKMPEMGGVELASILVREHRARRVVVMSGYTADEVNVPGVTQPVQLLRKPFTPGELRQRIRDVLAPTSQ